MIEMKRWGAKLFPIVVHITRVFKLKVAIVTNYDKMAYNCQITIMMLAEAQTCAKRAPDERGYCAGAPRA